MMLSQYSKVWEKFFFFLVTKCTLFEKITRVFIIQILAHIFLLIYISKPNLQFLAVSEMWKLCISWVYDFQSSSLKAAAADNEQKTCPGICHV